MKYVIALGGSIMCPDEINTAYLKRFSGFIKKQVKKGNKFVIITGGGKTARKYQKAAKALRVCPRDRDWIGIKATELNAELLKGIIKNKSVLIEAGQVPGGSTDWQAVKRAIALNIKEVMLLGKPDYVYTADFEKDKTARPVENLTWKEYFKIVTQKWSPGLSVPVDPTAAKLAQKKKIKIIVAAAADFKNLERILTNKNFKGTTIWQ
jgi:uridylate kinase